MGSPDIKDLFYKNRFVSGWHMLAALVYSPAGLVLALLRVFISLQAYLLALLLLMPELSFIRKTVLRLISLVMGVFVIEENPSQRDKNVRVLIANYSTVLDHIPVHLLTGCFSPCEWELWPLGLKMFEGSQDKHMYVASLRSHLHKSEAPLLLQPEETTTNSKAGLLKFGGWFANVGPAIQPVCLQAWRPLSITCSTLTSTFSADLFWFLFSPITVFRVRYLPVIQREEGETDEAMADRVAQAIARELGLAKTNFTAKDKYEYEKRCMLEWSRGTAVRPSHTTLWPNSEMQRMASQVAEVLPHVPHEAILRDLSRTRNIDLTISNILEGNLRFSFTPVPVPVPSTSEANCSSPHPFSAKDHMISFVERKARLIEQARRRYMEKHGLLSSQ